MLYEIRSGIRRSGQPILVDCLEGLTGYRSLYGFNEEVANLIKEQKGTYGLHGKPLFSDTLFIDIDDNPSAEVTVEKKLMEQGVGFQVYDSGNRGKHFHVPIKEMYGKDVAYRQKHFVAENYPGADTSIYKITGIIRLPGTYHYKNPGNTKKCIREYRGPKLEVTFSDIIPEVFNTEDVDPEAASKLSWEWFKKVGEGGRNRQIYNMAFLSSLAGYSVDEARDNLLHYNSVMITPPLSNEEVVRTVKSAYRRN